MPAEIHIASFYKFAPLPDYRQLQAPLRDLCADAGIRGTILLAAEGINATIAGKPDNLAHVLHELRQDPRFAELDIKRSRHNAIPFGKLKVRLKREIVALKVANLAISQDAGDYVEPQDWNALIQQDDVILLDARNDYEIALGGFTNALDPGTAAFHELPDVLSNALDPRRHRRVAMYCTGGIRCEKAAALLKDRGFDQVYQLRGGILNYLEQVDPADSLWHGECFVFDDRVSLDHQLAKGAARICDDCKLAVKPGVERCPACRSLNLL